MASTYYILCTVVDLRTLVRHTYVLGELHQFYAAPVSVGSDPSCDIILDDPDVLPRHALLTAGSNHRMVKILTDDGKGSGRHDGARPIPIGPFALMVEETTDVLDFGAPPPGLAVRFGSQRDLAITVDGAPGATAGREAEVARVFAALASANLVMIPPALRWCVTQVETHFERLSRATSPHPALRPTHIECHGSLGRACERWEEQWSAAESQPFGPSTWAYVQRLAGWIANRRNHRHYGLWDVELALSRLGRWNVDHHKVVVDAITGLLAAHVATFDDELSPIQPLVTLAERGVFAFALPDAGMLLYVSSLDGGDRLLLPSLDDTEVALLGAIAQSPDDHQQRRVYADLLEQRGRATAAAQMRATASGSAPNAPTTQRVEELFAAARPVLLARKNQAPEVPRVQPSGLPTTGAHLTFGATAFVLVSVTGIWWDDEGGTVQVRDLANTPEPSEAVDDEPQPNATITFAGETLWLRALDHSRVTVNDAYIDNETDTPLFEGDVMRLGDHRLVVHYG